MRRKDAYLQNWFLLRERERASVTRLGYFLCLGDFIIAWGNIFLPKIVHIFGLLFFQCHFSSESILGNFLLKPSCHSGENEQITEELPIHVDRIAIKF